MNSLKERNPVPFKQELAHLKKYLMLEEMRFGDLLHIEYDIQCSDFLIPQLSVQPLVENAVKHGVGMKEDGGTVTISTRETDDSYLVEVRDDGVRAQKRRQVARRHGKRAQPPQGDGERQGGDHQRARQGHHGSHHHSKGRNRKLKCQA